MSLFVGNKLKWSVIEAVKTSGNELTLKPNKETTKVFLLFLQSFCRFEVISTFKSSIGAFSNLAPPLLDIIREKTPLVTWT